MLFSLVKLYSLETLKYPRTVPHDVYFFPTQISHELT